MTERQALLYEARKKKPFRAFIMTCMWGGFGLMVIIPVLLTLPSLLGITFGFTSVPLIVIISSSVFPII